MGRTVLIEVSPTFGTSLLLALRQVLIPLLTFVAGVCPVKNLPFFGLRFGRAGGRYNS